MPRSNRRPERRLELVPVLADAFAELGYRRATTAELARRCGVRENVLYRLWPDKRAMFVAALDHVYRRSEAIWTELLARAAAGDPGDSRGEEPASAAERILAHEATHQGERGLYRIVFAGLSETDDAEIAAALRELYRRFQAFVREQVEAHRSGASPEAAGDAPDPALAAWAIVGLGTVSNLGRVLGLLTVEERERLFDEVGRALLGGR